MPIKVSELENRKLRNLLGQTRICNENFPFYFRIAKFKVSECSVRSVVLPRVR